MQRIPKVFLIVPPFCFIPAPLLGVPVLRGYLSQHGIECDSVDLNIRFLHWLIKESKKLDSLVDKSVLAFKALQGKAVLTPSEIPLLLHQAAVLAVNPPDLMRKHFGSEAILGLSKNRPPDSWIGHLPSLANALNLSGLLDFGEAISPAFAKDGLTARYEVIESFLHTAEARRILQQAATADVVGVSIPFFAQQIPSGFLIAQQIRKINPKAFIIFGGSGLSKGFRSYQPLFISHASDFDAVGLYEGELTLRNLVECLVENKDLDAVPDLLRLDRDKKAFLPAHHLPSPAMDELPTPVFNAEELEMYPELAGPWWPGMRVPLLISRGCYWDRCAFCSDMQCRHPETPSYQARRPEKVIDDIIEIQRKFPVSYFLLNTAALAPSWARRFAQGVLDRGIKAEFWSNMRANDEKAADGEFFVLLKKAGFDMISVGVESTVDPVLQAVFKGNLRSDIANTIQGIGRAGIRLKFHLIVDLPPTSVDDARSNWDFIVANLEHITGLTVFEFALMEDTYMGKHPEEFHLEVVKDAFGRPKMLAPGIMQHVNPFYARPEAREMVQRFKNLSQDLDFLKLTRDVREKIHCEGFRWTENALRFRPFSAVASRFVPSEVRPREVYLVILSDYFKYFIAPKAFFHFINVMRRAAEAPVPYADFLSAFTSGMKRHAPSMPAGKLGALHDRLLERLVREGFVLDIDLPAELAQKQNQKEAVLIPQEDLALSYNRSPLTDLPVAFGAFPFAGVISSKMA